MERFIGPKYYIKLFIDTREEPSIHLELESSVEMLTYDYIYKRIEDEMELQNDKFVLNYFCQKTKRVVKMESNFAAPVKDLADQRLEVILITRSIRKETLKKQMFLQK